MKNSFCINTTLLIGMAVTVCCMRTNAQLVSDQDTICLGRDTISKTQFNFNPNDSNSIFYVDRNIKVEQISGDTYPSIFHFVTDTIEFVTDIYNESAGYSFENCYLKNFPLDVNTARVSIIHCVINAEAEFSVEHDLRLTLDADTFKSNIDVNLSSSPKNRLLFANTQFTGKLSIGGTNNFGARIDSLNVKSSVFDVLDIFNASMLHSVYIFKCTSKHIKLRECFMPDTLDIEYCSVGNEILLQPVASQTKECQLITFGTDPSKFKMDYSYFKLLPIKSAAPGVLVELSRDEGIAMYEAYLKNFKDRGQTAGYEKLDIEYQEFKWATLPWYLSWIGVIADIWWQFGYAKERVFIWTLLLLMMFTIPTYFLLDFLNGKVYSIAAVKENEEIPDPFSDETDGTIKTLRSVPKRIWYSLVYTGTIFLALTLKTEKLKLTSSPNVIAGTLYVIFVYLTGIICLAYMANFVLQK